ncbi:acyltransferase 3 [Alkalidesulfovibrio alkalitolerans DSM 16529]|jgi:peptidoglycan/LPS O-acetylase OafA/YrhL|uniref:Acyltransferase 3 n=1 Tax=Alkalidesulfovibrio alkalitolerans DSM 16529 TaxID=1121439 RepID=S7THM4_9BACT|nr:acyltransferase [Alkalidesulfovibrio alkalitolerans]EPR36125.1 acyltransferase 3 [Alkalidesulfovibrio alkalitolerans DSM 16529]
MGLVRLFLALAVYFSHDPFCGVRLLPGGVAVQAFFVISGFYMALILREKYAGAPLSLFYGNRALRLAPTYFLVLACSAAALHFLSAAPLAGPRDFGAAMSGPAWPMIAWSNLLLWGDELLFLFALDPASGTFRFAPGGDVTGAYVFLLVPQAWSLSMEMSFYLLAPFLVRMRARTLVAIVLASLALRAGLLFATPGAELLARKIFFSEMWLFLLGMLAYEVHVANRARAAAKSLGLALFFGAMALAALFSGLPPVLKTPLWAACFALAVPHAFRLSAANRLDRFLGDLSYPFYIVHFLVISLVSRLADEPWGGTALALSLAAAVLLHLALERPIDRWRQARAARGAAEAGASRLPDAAVSAPIP